MTTDADQRFLGSRPLGRLLADIAPIVCLDIGARGGPKDDLLAIAPAASVYCFEPDTAECERLNRRFAAGSSPFRDVRFFPTALSRDGGPRTLYLTRHAGASSLLPPIKDVGAKFSRPQYVEVVDTCLLETVPLDAFAAQNRLPPVSHIKIDVEGLELEILQSASRMLADSVVAIRTEVAFLRLRDGQPLFCDLAGHLAGCGFIPMGFTELHHWRRYSKAKQLRVTSEPIPFSRGQLAHGDMLFFRDPDSLPTDGETARRTVLKAAFLAMAYGYVDHAAYLLNRGEINDWLASSGVAVEAELGTVARQLARQWNYTGAGRWFRRRKP